MLATHGRFEICATARKSPPPGRPISVSTAVARAELSEATDDLVAAPGMTQGVREYDGLLQPH